MRCHILNCLAALRIYKIRSEISQIENHEIVKRKVFAATCSMMINHIEYENNQVVVNKILATFLDNAKMSDTRSWLPMHCTMALFA
jgi:hypothetical protein